MSYDMPATQVSNIFANSSPNKKKLLSEIKLYFTFYNLWKKNEFWKLGRTSISTTEPSLLCASYLTTGFMEFIFCPISRICVTLLIIKKWSRSYLSQDLLFYDLVMKETNYDDDNRVEDDRNNAIHLEFHYFIRYGHGPVCVALIYDIYERYQ